MKENILRGTHTHTLKLKHVNDNRNEWDAKEKLVPVVAAVVVAAVVLVLVKTITVAVLFPVQPLIDFVVANNPMLAIVSNCSTQTWMKFNDKK